MKNTYIIKKNNDLKYVLKRGNYFISKYVVIHCNKNNNKDLKNYFAVCVSKKNGISVHRNKLKRWAREAYKFEENKIKKGYNIVILYKKTTKLKDLSFDIIYKDIKRGFKEINLYDNNENI